jgi:excisionase family DNA binding protein
LPSPIPSRPIDATLSVTKAARLLGVHPNTVRAWSDAGRLRYYRINPRGDRRYRVGDLQRFLTAAEIGSTDTMSGAPSAARRAAERPVLDLVSPTAGLGPPLVERDSA